MSSETICWLGSSGINPPRGGLMPGLCFNSHFSGSLESIWAIIAVKGSSLFSLLSSFGIIASFNGHSRSPLWCPKFPHLTHFTLRTSTANGLTLPGTPVSNLGAFLSTANSSSVGKGRPKTSLGRGFLFSSLTGAVCCSTEEEEAIVGSFSSGFFLSSAISAAFALSAL
uniref:Uncharacterized protein n=1 Tax=Opuntia streptacantha TaxID=393608 RepID=A0A7C9EJS3_OPUST